MRAFEQDLGGVFSADRFVNQFILGPEFVDRLEGWKQTSIDDGLKLTSHPALEVVQVTDGERALTLVGYILDPDNPTLTNDAIVNALLSDFSDFDSLFRRTETLGGRWLLIATAGRESILFTDALGLRQVFYTTSAFEQGFWAMSQPGLLAWLLKLKVDEEAVAYLQSDEMRDNHEYKWPVAASPFRHIRRLLPNHYLNTGTRQARRYWPYAPLEPIGLDQELERAALLLQGLMDAAYARFEPVHGITAGYDSRTVLAAARKHKARIQTLSVQRATMPDKHRDLTVPARMLKKQRIPHSVIKTSSAMSARFSRAFQENVFLAHDHYGLVAEAILDQYARKSVVVTGSGAEVIKSCYRDRIDGDKRFYTGEELSRINHMGENPFAVKYFTGWMRNIGEHYNVPVLDLLAWEHMDGSWLAMVQMEYDYAWREVFTPFNCRALLTGLLSIDEGYRKRQDYQAIRMLIDKMWPELLDQPFNPVAKSRIPRVPRALWRGTKKMVKRHIAG